MKGGRGARIKGTTFEREIVNYLKSCGIDAHRVPLSGAVTNYKGDVLVTVGDQTLKAECKRRARAFLSLSTWLGENAFLVVRDDRSPTLAVMRIEQLVDLIKRKKNEPELPGLG